MSTRRVGAIEGSAETLCLDDKITESSTDPLGEPVSAIIIITSATHNQPAITK